LKENNNSRRIAKNSMMLYIRMIFTMAVTLYTSRVVLNVLGVSEYGIYNVIGGVVMMFSSINTTIATAVQRFMNFEMGRKNFKGLNDIFNTSVIIHFFIAGIVFVLLETLGDEKVNDDACVEYVVESLEVLATHFEIHKALHGSGNGGVDRRKHHHHTSNDIINTVFAHTQHVEHHTRCVERYGHGEYHADIQHHGVFGNASAVVIFFQNTCFLFVDYALLARSQFTLCEFFMYRSNPRNTA
jgi:hypothetical protein